MTDCQSIFIEQNKLRIVNFTEKHITPSYISWLNDKAVVKYSELRHHTHTYESCLNYFRSFQNTDNYFWAIEVFEKNKWVHVGNINAYFNTKNNIADIGILIGEKSIWGKGVGLLAWKAVCDFLFDECRVRKVTGGAMSANKAMLKIMQRVGMVEDGKRERHYVCDGEEIDILHYALFSDQRMI